MNRRNKNEKFIKILLKIVVIIILSVISFYSFALAFDKNKNEDESKIYRYNTNKNVNYNVKLKQNSFIDKNELGMNLAYISKLINEISAKLSYSYSSDKSAKLTYKYEVNAKLVGTYDQNAEDEKDSSIWSKTFNLVSPTKKSVEGTNFEISENVNINYKEYSDLVDKFIKEVGIPISAYLDVELAVDVTGNVSETNLGIKTADTVHLKIPIDEDVTKISYDNNISGNNEVSENKSFGSNINYVFLTIGVLIFGVIIFLVIRFVFEIFDSLGYRVKHSPYINHINKILNDYNDIIVEVNSRINTTQYNVVEVKNFNEMVDLEEELRSPILCYSDDINLTTTFTIINNKQLYIFKIKESDFDK